MEANHSVRCHDTQDFAVLHVAVVEGIGDAQNCTQLEDAVWPRGALHQFIGQVCARDMPVQRHNGCDIIHLRVGEPVQSRFAHQFDSGGDVFLGVIGIADVVQPRGGFQEQSVASVQVERHAYGVKEMKRQRGDLARMCLFIAMRCAQLIDRWLRNLFSCPPHGRGGASAHAERADCAFLIKMNVQGAAAQK